MKSIIFNQRVTVFTNSFIGYSDIYKQELSSKFGDIEEIGGLSNFTLIVGFPQNISQNQIQPNTPWFIKFADIKIEFQPSKIDVISNKFIATEKDEEDHIMVLINVLKQIDQIISIGNITRMAYVPSLGFESTDETSMNSYWNSIIKIPDVPNSTKLEKTVRYNTICNQDLNSHSHVTINRVVTLAEGQRTYSQQPNSKIEGSRSIECVIATIDINTSGFNGHYTIEDLTCFCDKAKIMERELLCVLIDNK